MKQRRRLDPDRIAHLRRKAEVETWAGRRRFRLEGVNLCVGPRDMLMPAVISAPNVSGQSDTFRFAIRPAYHVDDRPEQPLIQQLSRASRASSAC